MTWPVFVINMADNTKRMSDAAAELERLGISFTRFDAVNGRAIPENELARVYDPVANLRRARHPMIGPEIGCYLSHIALWEKIAAGDAAGGIILEDDFAAAEDLAAVLAAVSADEGHWDIVKLFSARGEQKLLDQRPLVAGREIAVPYKVPNAMLGYAIRRETAARLAKCTLPVSRPVDEDLKHFWEFGLRISMVSPSPLRFGTLSTETGTITEARRHTTKVKLRTALRQAWRSVRFRLNYIVKLHWHRTVRKAR
jgi:glycosyl transferase, family 25